MSVSFVRDTLANAVAGAFVTLGGFGSSVLVARLLGVGGMGIIAYASWAVTLSIIVADVGIPGALSRFLPEVRAREGESSAGGLVRMLLRPFLWSTLGVGALFCIYAVLQWRRHGLGEAWPLAPDTFQFSPLFWGLVAISCTAQSLASFAGGYLQGQQRYADLARLAIVGSVVQIVGTAAGALAFGAAGALAAMALGAFVPAWALLTRPAVASSPGAALRKRVLRYMLDTWGYYLVTAFFASRMEVFFLERSWGSHAVGLFTVSLTLSNLAIQGPLLLTGALLPRLSQHLGRGEVDIARALYPISLRLMCLVVFPACFGTAAIAPALLSALYGSAFSDAVPSAVILVSGAAIAACSSVAGTYANASSHTRFALLLGLVGAALSTALGLTVVPQSGPLGAACGRVGVQLFVGGAMTIYALVRLDCRVPVADLARIALAALCCAVLARGIVDLLPNAAGLALAVFGGAINYFLALTLLMPLPAGDLNRLVASAAALPASIRPAVQAAFTLIARAPSRVVLPEVGQAP